MGNVFYKVLNSKRGIIGFRHKIVDIDEEMVVKLLKPREPDTYKKDYGQVLVIAGSMGFAGAAYLTTQSAVRSGAGLVTLCTSKEIQDIMSIKLNEAMTINFDQGDKIGNLAVKADCIAIGPGMGANETTRNILKEILELAECPVIIDADGLNVLQNNLDILERKNGPVILTPHYGEMSRIANLSVEDIKDNKIEVAREFAKENQVILLLKDHNTIITDGDYVLRNTSGNSAMSSGGMGDTLTGIIASMVAQGYEPMEAVAIATFIHGYCADKLSKEMFCVNATHIIEEIPFIIRDLINLKDQ